MNLKSLFILVLLAGFVSSDAEARKEKEFYRAFKIVVFGDTFSSGYQLTRSDTYAIKLRTRLNEEYDRDRIEVINASVDGDTATSAAARIQSVLAEKPDIVIVALGGTDAIHQLDPGITSRALDQVVGVLTHNNIYTLLAGFRAPSNVSLEYASQYNLMYPRLADRYRLSYVEDMLKGVQNDEFNTLFDRIFPNEEGMDVIADNLYPILNEMFIKIRVQRGRNHFD